MMLSYLKYDKMDVMTRVVIIRKRSTVIDQEQEWQLYKKEHTLLIRYQLSTQQNFYFVCDSFVIALQLNFSVLRNLNSMQT